MSWYSFSHTMVPGIPTFLLAFRTDSTERTMWYVRCVTERTMWYVRCVNFELNMRSRGVAEVQGEPFKDLKPEAFYSLRQMEKVV